MTVEPDDAPWGDVTVAWVHSDTVDISFFHSFLALQAFDLAVGGGRLGQTMPMRCASGGIVKARNAVVTAFLESDSQWLWWIDTDMGFEPNALDGLLHFADATERPIVGGLCFAQMERDADGMGGYVTEAIPTLYKWVVFEDGVQGFVSWRDYPRNALAEVHATGSAFVLIHRSALEKVAAQFGEGTWYDQVPNPGGGLLGEDLSFCTKARMAGVPVFVHTGIGTTHRKPRWLSEADYPHPADFPELAIPGLSDALKGA